MLFIPTLADIFSYIPTITQTFQMAHNVLIFSCLREKMPFNRVLIIELISFFATFELDELGWTIPR